MNPLSRYQEMFAFIIAICLVVTCIPKTTNKPSTEAPNEIEEVLDTQKPEPKQVLLEEKVEPSKVVVEADNYQPTWDVEGNYAKAQDRQSLIVHLNGPNHNFTMQKLNSMSTDELQRLHDQDHESKRGIIRSPLRFFRRR